MRKLPTEHREGHPWGEVRGEGRLPREDVAKLSPKNRLEFACYSGGWRRVQNSYTPVGKRCVSGDGVLGRVTKDELQIPGGQVLAGQPWRIPVNCRESFKIVSREETRADLLAKEMALVNIQM